MPLVSSEEKGRVGNSRCPPPNGQKENVIINSQQNCEGDAGFAHVTELEPTGEPPTDESLCGRANGGSIRDVPQGGSEGGGICPTTESGDDVFCVGENLPESATERELEEPLASTNEACLGAQSRIPESGVDASTTPGEGGDRDESGQNGHERPQSEATKAGRKGKKGKKGRSKEVLIDEDMINKVKMLVRKNAQLKEGEEERGKGKGKRRGSKSEGTSPAPLPEDFSISQRRILRRGPLWRRGDPLPLRHSEGARGPPEPPSADPPQEGGKRESSLPSQTSGKDSNELDASNYPLLTDESKPEGALRDVVRPGGAERVSCVEASGDFVIPSDNTLGGDQKFRGGGDQDASADKAEERQFFRQEEAEAWEEPPEQVDDSRHSKAEEEEKVTSEEGRKDGIDGREEVYSFSATVSVIEPSRASVEFVSDHSSPSRSSSNDRETVVATRLRLPEGTPLEEETEDVRLSPLFGSVAAARLDGTTKLHFKHRKRHSLPKATPLRGTLPASGSLDGAPPRYESAGEVLYDEKCQCGPAVVVDHDHSDSEDSDNTGHHKYIREKIKRIIGSRLQPRPDREMFPEEADARAESPFPRSSSHSASASPSEPSEAAPPQDLDYRAKLALNPNTLSLTYVTDSEVEAGAPAAPDEGLLLLDSLMEEKQPADTCRLTGKALAAVFRGVLCS